MSGTAKRITFIVIAVLLGVIAGIVAGFIVASLGGAHSAEHGTLSGAGTFIAVSLFIMTIENYLKLFD